MSTLSAKPVVFQVLDPIRPGETLLLFGAGISPAVTAEGLRISDDAIKGPPQNEKGVDPDGTAVPLKILQGSDLSAKVVIPDAWKLGIYAVRLHGADGRSTWQFVNRPALWWQISGKGGKANPGDRMRIYGKNFGVRPRVWLNGEAGFSWELAVIEAGENNVTVALPPELARGVYRVWLHNGWGGSAGFGAPLEIQVAPAEAWPQTIFNVHDFGAKGNNRVDDTAAIRRALDWAGHKGGGIVFLPRGTYLVTGKLVVPPKTVLRGESRATVTIKVPHVWPPASGLLPEFDGLLVGGGDFAVEDLSIIAQQVQRIVAAPDVPSMFGPGMARVPASTPSANGVRLRNLRIRHLYFANRIAEIDPGKGGGEGPSTIAVKGADFLLRDSEVISPGMPIQILAATRAEISGNVLRTGRGWYGLWDFRDGLFEKNDIAAGDLAGGFGGIQGVASNVMFAANRWHHAFGGEREALTFDAPYFATWMGTVESEGRTIHLGKREGGRGDVAAAAPEDLLAVIAGGRGVGDAVPVAKVSADRVELVRPFAVAPDAKSVIVLGAKKSHVLIVDNGFEDASVAAQLYAQSHEFVIARNHCERTGGSYSSGYDAFDGARDRRYSYSLFNQWIDNVFEEGLVFDQGPWPDAYVGCSVQRSAGLKETTPTIGNRFVGNRLTGGTSMGATTIPHIGPENLKPDAVPMARDVIFEHNTVAYQSPAITVDPGYWFTLLRGNATEHSANPVVNEGSRTVVEKFTPSMP